MFKFKKISMLLGSFVAISPIMIAASCEKKNENKQDTNKNNNQNNLMLDAQNNNSNKTQDSKNDNKDLMSQAQGDDPNVISESESKNEENPKSSKTNKKDDQKKDLNNKKPSANIKNSGEKRNDEKTPKVIIKSHDPKNRTIGDLFKLVKEYSNEFAKTVENDYEFFKHLAYNSGKEGKLYGELLKLSKGLNKYSSYQEIIKKQKSSPEDLKKGWKEVVDFYEKVKNELNKKYDEYKKSKK